MGELDREILLLLDELAIRVLIQGACKMEENVFICSQVNFYFCRRVLFAQEKNSDLHISDGAFFTFSHSDWHFID